MMATHLQEFRVSLFRGDKDFGKIKDFFKDYILDQGKLLSIEEFNRLKSDDLQKLNHYLLKYEITYSELVKDGLGIAVSYSPVLKKQLVCFKEEILSLIKEALEDFYYKYNRLPKYKEFATEINVELREIKRLFGWTYYDLLRNLPFDNSIRFFINTYLFKETIDLKDIVNGVEPRKNKKYKNIEAYKRIKEGHRENIVTIITTNSLYGKSFYAKDRGLQQEELDIVLEVREAYKSMPTGTSLEFSLKNLGKFKITKEGV